MDDPEDSQGKKKVDSYRSEWSLIYAALFIGACLGFLWSQSVYVWVVKAQSLQRASGLDLDFVGKAPLPRLFAPYQGSHSGNLQEC